MLRCSTVRRNRNSEATAVVCRNGGPDIPLEGKSSRGDMVAEKIEKWLQASGSFSELHCFTSIKIGLKCSTNVQFKQLGFLGACFIALLILVHC